VAYTDLLGLALALSMDALAVALAVGFTLRDTKVRHPLRVGACFGLFQATTVLLGWLAGRTARRHIAEYVPWVAFALLALIGADMVREALRREQRSITADATRGWTLIVLSLATSVDGLVVGVPLAMLDGSVVVPVLVIGVVVACLTGLGVLAGSHVGSAWGRRAELAGGLGLFVIAARILLAHILAS
jgi:putative Mn2+ efflux pump MntP